MLSTFYRASTLGLQSLLKKGVPRIDRERCINRLFHTRNMLAAANKTDDPPKTLDWKISESDAEFILDKFNTSPASELMKIKYVSQIQANSIVAHRDEKGQFEKVADLLKFPKIGQKRLQTICKSMLDTSSTETEQKFVYSPEDEQTILKALNTFTEQELCTVDSIGKLMTKTILEYREQHGAFETIDDALKVKRIGSMRLQQICQSILDPVINKKAPADKEYVHDLAKLQSVQDLVTINIGLNDITWLHMTKGRDVLQWSIHNIDSINPTKWLPQQYFNVVKDIVSQLPTIDLYLLEHQASFGQSKKEVYHIFTFIRSLEALFLGLLNADTGNYGTLGAVSVPANVTGRHFDLMVGTTSIRASGQDMVKTMLKEQWKRSGASLVVNDVMQAKQDNNGDGQQFTINENVAQVFHGANHFQKELMANSLLQAITFFDKIEQYE